MERTSFRDPQGTTRIGTEGVTRVAFFREPSHPDGILPSELIRAFQSEGKWIPATEIDPGSLAGPKDGSPLRPTPTHAWSHPRVFFPSYSHEWSPSMLADAGSLTLELNERLLGAGWELKDATPTNVLYEGHTPLFVDHLSPQRRKPGQMGWVAYGQFIRTFIIPLCLNRLRGIPLTWMGLSSRDGISPETALNLLGPLDRFRPSVLGIITLPARMTEKGKSPTNGSIRTWKSGDEVIGAEVTRRLLNGLHRRIRSNQGGILPATVWGDYDQASESYSADGLLAKEDFLKTALDSNRPATVLDLGCNTGRYSRLSAKSGARVVSVDGDAACVDRLYRAAKSVTLDIQPL